jgi:hypothetical protein
MTAVTATTAPLSPDLARTDLAVLRTRHHVSELSARGAYGLRGGYTSLDAALSHLGNLTKGDARKGVAIVQQGDRFYGVRVLEKVLDARTKSGMRGSWLDMEDDSKLSLAPWNKHEALVAVVDGSKVLRAARTAN